jgi:hypothetical protein
MLRISAAQMEDLRRQRQQAFEDAVVGRLATGDEAQARAWVKDAIPKGLGCGFRIEEQLFRFLIALHAVQDDAAELLADEELTPAVKLVLLEGRAAGR